MNNYHNRGIPTPKYETGPNCDGCPYRDYTQGYVPPSGSPSSQYMVLAEAPAYEEVKEGRPLVGGSGRTTWSALRRGSSIGRDECYVSNVVRCRCIKWVPCRHCGGSGCDAITEVNGYSIECFNGQIPEFGRTTRDYVNANPSQAQVKECTSRYLHNGELEKFEGNTILTLGAHALSAMAGRNLGVKEYEGSVFERGDTELCQTCSGTGRILPTRVRKCKDCHGQKEIYVETTERCVSHPRYAGKTRSTRSCSGCDVVYRSSHTSPDCASCDNTGTVKVELAARKCGHCFGEGAIMKGDAINANVTKYLKPGQLLIPTYHPSYVTGKDRSKLPAFDATLARVSKLHLELSDMAANPFEVHIVRGNSELAYEYGLTLPVPPIVSIDIENPRNADPRSTKYDICSVSTSAFEAKVFKPGHPTLRRMLDADRIIGQYYLIHDAWWLYHNEGKKFKQLWDTQQAGHLLNPDVPHNLSTMAVQYAMPPMQGYWKSRQNYAQNNEGVCGVDTVAAWRIATGQRELLLHNNQLRIMEDNVIPLCNVVFDIRVNGCKVDEARMVNERNKLEAQLESNRKSLPFDGTEWSPKVADTLYGYYDLPSINERDGYRNTRKLTLETLAQRLEDGRIDIPASKEALAFVNSILEMRATSKLISTFLSHELTEGRVHPILNPAGTATLRLSCKSPNLQQVPKGVRHIFVPDHPDYEFTSCDISQAEIVTFLWLAQEWELYEKVLGGYDFHQMVADRMGIERKIAKVANFAILYNEDPDTTAQRNRWEKSVAYDLHREYHKHMRGVKRYQAEITQMCKETGYVLSPHGVRRILPLKSGETQGHIYNQAVNAPIQTTPAMVTRIAMVYLQENLPKDCRVWMQVHDDVIVQHPKDLREEVHKCLLLAMSRGSWTDWVQHPLDPSSTKELKFSMQPKSGPDWGSV